MILTRTPLRVSLFGGGSDIPSFYNISPGSTLSFTIDKYMYIALCRTAYPGVKLVYNDIELVKGANEISHTRVRHCLEEFDIDSHVEISSFCEIPTKGTGLGSSSTFTVGMINALARLKSIDMNSHDIADLACDIEINKCGEPIGKQDQYAAAIGGMNVFKYYKDKVTHVIPSVKTQTLTNLNNNLMMFYTGITRNASDILNKQTSSETNIPLLKRMVEMVDQAQIALENGDIDKIGLMLDDSWHLKRQLADNISNDIIDAYYKKAIVAGALGGKILGAGGGGYFLFYVPSDKQDSVRRALSNLQQFDFKFENTGTTVVYDESKRTF